MKKTIVLILCILASLQVGIIGHAVSMEQETAIKKILNEECKKSGVPGLSVSIVNNEKTEYFSSGYANKDKEIRTDKSTLYELASLSKSYTALGIFILEQKGYLNLDDSIKKYLPWFQLKFKEKNIDMTKVKISNLIYHTSGLTNASHTKLILKGDSDNMLERTVKNLNNSTIDFPPGEQYEYGTVNYDILGLVIEKISQKSYEEFMESEVFKPLKFKQTFAFESKAKSTNKLAQGYRSTFMTTKDYRGPSYRGNKPAGYLISSSEDIASWMNYQLGNTDGLPEYLANAIKKSHIANKTVPKVDSLYYAGGWEVNSTGSIIEHAGNNPSFTNYIVLFPKDQIGIGLLSNSNTTNIELVYKIKSILEGDLKQSYSMGNIRSIDLIFTVITIVAAFSSLVFIFLGIHFKNHSKHKKTRLRSALKFVFIAFFLVLTSLLIFLPLILGIDWISLIDWEPSIVTASIAVILLNMSIIVFILNPFRKIKNGSVSGSK